MGVRISWQSPNTRDYKLDKLAYPDCQDTDLIALVKAATSFSGCPLCGEHHKLTFHSYPYRQAVGSGGERSRIRVATILCQASRDAGRPYTKRFLPEHLIWRSPFSSGKLVALLEAGADSAPGFTNAACAALGCIDPRTARKHINALRSAVDAKLPILAELGAAAPGLTESQTFLPGTNPFVILNLLWDGFLKATVELSGSLAVMPGQMTHMIP